MTEPRRRRYAPRPEKISLGWPSAFKIALIVFLFLLVIEVLFAACSLSLLAVSL